MRQLTKLVLSFLLCFSLLACSKISQRQFDKIKTNMNMQEVEAILGKPTNAETITVAGMSGTSLVWKDSHAEIDIQMLNDRVAVKSFSSLDEEQPNTK